MSPAILGSALGAAAVTVGRGAATALGNSLSFASELLRAAGAPAERQEENTPATSRDRAAILPGIDMLRERIRQALAAAGITLNQPVELASDGAGGIYVTADHPQRAAIEEALRADYLLEYDFCRLAGDYRDCTAQQGARDLPPTLTIAVPAGT